MVPHLTITDQDSDREMPGPGQGAGAAARGSALAVALHQRMKAAQAAQVARDPLTERGAEIEL